MTENVFTPWANPAIIPALEAFALFTAAYSWRFLMRWLNGKGKQK